MSRVEIESASPTFLKRLFDGNLQSSYESIVGDELIRLVLLGGFPEAIRRANERRRQTWFRSYLASLLSKDISDIATVEIMTELPKLVRILAQHSGQLVNYSKLGSAIGVSYKTAQRCTALLEQLFLMSTLQPWHTNALKRIVKTPKLHFVDSGLLSTVRGSGFNRIKYDRVQLGAPLESFVHSELAKLIGADDMQWSIHHFRDQQLREVDFVLERDDGLIAGIEVKASATVGHRDFAGLISLSSACKQRFAAGIVLYDGDVFVPFGDDMAAVLISALWA